MFLVTVSVPVIFVAVLLLFFVIFILLIERGIYKKRCVYLEDLYSHNQIPEDYSDYLPY